MFVKFYSADIHQQSPWFEQSNDLNRERALKGCNKPKEFNLMKEFFMTFPS